MSEPLSCAPEHEARRLLWRCRRGMRELDVLLERYLATGYAAAGEGQRSAFAGLLELSDPELHALLVGRVEPRGEALREVVRAITRPAP